ncbi:DUF4924 family protein [Paracrocinitomix mangrovi]|uniref:DUF4924 family protein n=1 Tax=Paracrocinitomix mangrovi TaxID=2862509 RepID=UPI001C8E33A7|nr:DUF4924 family protein [Paracrocinitomix mangrovi]UKN02611.1 DUF4924 family protein [Paracrocinitomix mangrovi]
MLIAQKTKESNIAEHVIYMFQIEDLIRANQLDLDTIITTIIEPQIQDENLLEKYKEWYGGLIKQMKREGVAKQGHTSDINEIIMELLMLHNTLLNILDDKGYKERFEKALPALKDFQHKSNSADINIVEVALNALYGKIILKLKGQSFTASTEEAFGHISQMLGYLAIYYKKMRNGDLNFANN